MSSRLDEFLFGNRRRMGLGCGGPFGQPVTSVFRANRETSGPQRLPIEMINPQGLYTYTQVLYPNELLDTNNEYDQVSSTFIPKQNGVYSLNASIGWTAQGETPFPFYQILEIRANGNPIAENREYGPNSFSSNIVSVSVIKDLKAGDRVTVWARSLILGDIVTNPSQTHFEGIRIG